MIERGPILIPNFPSSLACLGRPDGLTGRKQTLRLEKQSKAAAAVCSSPIKVPYIFSCFGYEELVQVVVPLGSSLAGTAPETNAKPTRQRSEGNNVLTKKVCSQRPRLNEGGGELQHSTKVSPIVVPPRHQTFHQSSLCLSLGVK